MSKRKCFIIRPKFAGKQKGYNMEIRIIQEEELKVAAGLSRYVFDHSLRQRMEFTQTISFVEDYLTTDNLSRLVQEGTLTVWGAFDEMQLVGVSALQSDGMITMLYVLPQFWNKGIGRSLLNTMRVYAKNVHGVEKVLLNATPAWTAFYFVKQGFSYLQPGQNMRVPFVPMYVLTNESVVPLKRRIPKHYIVMAVGFCFLFATVSTWVFMNWYLK